MDKNFIYEGACIRKSPESYAVMSVPLGWVVLPARAIINAPDRRRLHGQWVVIKSKHQTIFRIVAFNGGLEILDLQESAAQLVIDWMGWVELHDYDGDTNAPLDLTIEKAHIWQIMSGYLRHADPAYRLSSWATVLTTLISVVIGYILGKI